MNLLETEALKLMKNQLGDADLDHLATFIDSLAEFDLQDAAEENPSRAFELYLYSFFAPSLTESHKEL